MTTRSTTDPAGLDAAACTAAVMAVRWASDTEWQDRPTILARALTAAAPHIRQAALLEACQSIKDYADEYAEWSGQQAWDRGYVAGMKQAAFDVAHSIRTPAIAKINPSAETNDRPQQTEAPTERRNVHCSNCGNTRGGPLGHETSECTWHATQSGHVDNQVPRITGDDDQAEAAGCAHCCQLLIDRGPTCPDCSRQFCCTLCAEAHRELGTCPDPKAADGRLAPDVAAPWTGEGCCRAANYSEGNAHDHPVGSNG